MTPPDPVTIEWLRNIKAHELFDVLRPLWSLEKLFDLAYHIDPGGQECLTRLFEDVELQP
jgi:hypothetical protein